MRKAQEEEKVIFSGKHLQIVQQKMGLEDDTKKVIKEKTFERARRAPGVRLLVISRENKIAISKERRYELNERDFRIPGGKVFDSLKEYADFCASWKEILPLAQQAAKKEAQEELGIQVNGLEFFKKSSAWATVEWDLYYFVVRDFDISEHGQQLEDGELVDVQRYTLEEAKQLALSWKMQEDRSVSVLLQYLHHKKGKTTPETIPRPSVI